MKEKKTIIHTLKQLFTFFLFVVLLLTFFLFFFLFLFFCVSFILISFTLKANAWIPGIPYYRKLSLVLINVLEINAM